MWTGKIYDEEICDYKDLEIKDLRNTTVHSFLFIDKKNCVYERDILISNSNFIIYEDTEYLNIDKDLSKKWTKLLKSKIQHITLN